MESKYSPEVMEEFHTGVIDLFTAAETVCKGWEEIYTKTCMGEQKAMRIGANDIHPFSCLMAGLHGQLGLFVEMLERHEESTKEQEIIIK